MVKGKGISPRLQDQLANDLGTGRPIPFRRVPGTRKYQNPYTGQIVTEHYVVRIYRPQLGLADRYIIQEQSKRYQKRRRRYEKSLLDTYMARQEALGNSITRSDARRSPEFIELNRRLTAISIESRQFPIGSPEREQFFRPDGEYAQILVALGRRLDGDDFPVGMSQRQLMDMGLPIDASYINSVVLPTLSAVTRNRILAENEMLNAEQVMIERQNVVRHIIADQ